MSGQSPILSKFVPSQSEIRISNIGTRVSLSPFRQPIAKDNIPVTTSQANHSLFNEFRSLDLRFRSLVNCTPQKMALPVESACMRKLPIYIYAVQGNSNLLHTPSTMGTNNLVIFFLSFSLSIRLSLSHLLID